jgi:hypothetical protein
MDCERDGRRAVPLALVVVLKFYGAYAAVHDFWFYGA